MLIVCLVFKKLPDDLPKWPHHSASHQPWMRVPVAPRPHQYVVMSVFSVHFILVCESCNTWDAVGVKKMAFVYLKFKFTWASCILSDTHTLRRQKSVLTSCPVTLHPRVQRSQQPAGMPHWLSNCAGRSVGKLDIVEIYNQTVHTNTVR